MTTVPVEDEPPFNTDDTGPPPSWEFPEIAAVVVLVAVGLLVLGGIAAGIAESLRNYGVAAPPEISNQRLGSSLAVGGDWATTALTAVLLGVMGLCWWNLREKVENDLSAHNLNYALRHIQRWHMIAPWVQAGLIISVLAAIAQFVGVVIEQSGRTEILAPYFLAGANMLAVLVLAAAGVLLVRRLIGRPELTH